jgi:hypothetical protein
MMAESGASSLIGEMAIVSENMEDTTTPRHERKYLLVNQSEGPSQAQAREAFCSTDYDQMDLIIFPICM